MLDTDTQTHRFAVLDGLRGVAALAVLILHLVQQHELSALPFAGLAVDFFYLLSGFVIAFAYERRLQSKTMDFSAFAYIRIARLYPLILLGTMMGIVLALVAIIGKHGITYQQVAVSGALALLLMPSYVFPQWETAYPFNMASWSLTFELVINFLYCLISPFLTTKKLVALIIASLFVLYFVYIQNDGVGGGNNQNNFYYGFGRVAFPFFTGVLIYRLRLPQILSPQIALFIMIVLAGALLVPCIHSGIVSLLYVTLLFPCIIFIAASVSAGTRIDQYCRFAGEISYPIYILQGPIIRIGEELLKHFHSTPSGYWCFGIAEAVVVAIIAYVALEFYDKPLRIALAPRVKSALAQAIPSSRDNRVLR